MAAILGLTGISSQSVIASLFVGAIIGLVELFFVHNDERGLGWMSHGLHALPVAIILTFVSFHTELIYLWFPSVFGKNPNVWIDGGIRVLIGLIATFKVKSAAAVIQGHNSIGEKLGHAFIIGALIAASPYIYIFLSNSGVLPSWVSMAKTAAKAR